MSAWMYGLAYGCFGVAISLIPGAVFAAILKIVFRELVRLFTTEYSALQSAGDFSKWCGFLLVAIVAVMGARHGARQAAANAGVWGPLGAFVAAVIMLTLIVSSYLNKGGQ